MSWQELEAPNAADKFNDKPWNLIKKNQLLNFSQAYVREYLTNDNLFTHTISNSKGTSLVLSHQKKKKH